MTTVVLAEKPNQAKSYAQAFDKSERKDGYLVVTDRILSDETFITYGFGHLVDLYKPEDYNEDYKSWDLKQLPIYPNKFLYRVSEGKNKQFKIVKTLLDKADTVIIATDCDREGENIAWSIINQTKINKANKIFKRLWINSLEKEVIKKGFQNLQDDSKYYNYYLEAEARKKSDWLVGMNLTRLYTKLAGGSRPLNIGRVQTPTLYMIYKRNKEIKNFQVSKYYELGAEILAGSEKFDANLTPSQQFKTKSSLITFRKDKGLEKASEVGIIESIKKEQKLEPSPRLFSLSSLQSEMNKRYKASASQTLAAVQKLYEAKLLSYPRTDCNYITEAEFSYLKENFVAYRTALGSKLKLVNSEPNSRYVNNKKVQEHYAIIPTKKIPTSNEFSKFTDLERNLYAEVLRRTVGMFVRKYYYDETTIVTGVGVVKFITKGKTPLKQGWKLLWGKKKKSADNLPLVQEGQEVKVTFKELEKDTKPPQYFTEGTLITAMKTAGKTLSDKEYQDLLRDVEGIGTEATRANIIEKLKKDGYIEIKKNKIHVTSLGQRLCRAATTSKLLVSPELTAQWEKKLKEISKGQYTEEQFIDQTKHFIDSLVDNPPKVEKESVNESLGTCPKCKQGQILDKGKFYGCSNYKKDSSSSCDFTISKTIAKKTISTELIKEIISGQETKVISGFKGKTGKNFSAKLKLNQENKVVFVFQNNDPKVKKHKGKSITK